ncbi:hypothetical protein ES705_31788 [subsurface metagenome]
MKITVKLYGVLRKYATYKKPSRWEGLMPEGAIVADLLNSVKCPKGKVIRIILIVRLISQDR